MNIYVGNLSFDASEDAVREAFENYGEVSSVKIITDQYSGKSKGFGFVEMANNDEANAAISGLSGQDMMGRTLNVSEARPRNNDRGGRGGGGGGYGKKW